MLVIAMTFAACWGVVELAALGSLTRTVRAGTLWLAVGTGIYGCGILALSIQYAYTRLLASVSDTPLHDIVNTASYTIDPFVEEIVKVLPLLLLAALAKSRLQRGFTDYLLLGAATGAGFGLLEAVMRFGSRAGTAIRTADGWALPMSLQPPVIPGPGVTVTAWLPAPVGSYDFLSLGSGVDLDLHLAWSAVAGLGVGLLVRGKGPIRLLGPIFVLLAGWDHAAYNYHLAYDGPGTSTLGQILSSPFVTAQPLLRWWPLLALVAAVVLDLRLLWQRQAEAPRLAREPQGLEGSVALFRYAFRRLPWTLLVILRFVSLRRAALYDGDPAGELRGEVTGIRDQLDAADSATAWRRVGPLRARPPQKAWLRLYWPLAVWGILVLPALLYYIVGSTRSTAGIQGALEHRSVFVIVLVVPLVAGLTLLARQLTRLIRTLPEARRAPSGEAATSALLRIVMSVGAGALGIITLAAWLHGTTPESHLVSNFHVLDALSSILLVGGLALTIAALIFFPPALGLATVALVGGETMLVPTIAISSGLITTAGLGVAGIVLSQAASNASKNQGGSGSTGNAGIPQAPPRPEPPVSNWKLRNIVDSLWKGTGGANRVGDGTTMDAVRNELRTGRPTQGLFHSDKAQQSINALTRWLRQQGLTANPSDRLWAWRLRAELENALKGK